QPICTLPPHLPSSSSVPDFAASTYRSPAAPIGATHVPPPYDEQLRADIVFQAAEPPIGSSASNNLAEPIVEQLAAQHAPRSDSQPKSKRPRLSHLEEVARAAAYFATPPPFPPLQDRIYS